MSLTLTKVRVAPRAEVVPRSPMFPPVPAGPGGAEPYPPAPEPSPTTTAGRTHRFRGWLARWRNRLLQWREEAVRKANHAGIEMGRAAGRSEIAAHIRAELEAGRYDYRDGNGAVRLILAGLAEDPTTP